MPNPINSVTFTPAADGRAVCTATYSCQQTGTGSADWPSSSAGPGTKMRLVRTSDSTELALGPFWPATKDRLPQTYRITFDISAADGEVEVQIVGSGGAGGTSINYWDVDLTVELVKK